MSVEIVFLIPLRPKFEQDVWDLTCFYLERTILSLKNQTNSSFEVYIAGHEQPESIANIKDSRFKFVEVDFGKEVAQENKSRDRNWKVAFAGMAASNCKAQSYMSLDADDLLHRDFVSEMKKLAEFDIVFVRNGFEWDMQIGRILNRKDFHKRCGSSIVLRKRAFELPQNRTWQEWLKMPHLGTPHHEFEEWARLRKNEYLVGYLNKPFVMYRTRNGANFVAKTDPLLSLAFWKRNIGFLLKGQKLNSDLSTDFSIESLESASSFMSDERK